MSEIKVSDLTTVELDGQGVYDKMMRVYSIQLLHEHSSGRIQGPDYAKALISAQQSAMAQAVQFLLGAEVAAKQADLISKQIEKIEREFPLIQLQIDRAASEAELMAQKLVTEKAQTQDIVNGVSITGVIGKQKTLYQAQIDGFSRDAEQQLAKLMVGVFNNEQAVGGGMNNVSAGVGESDIKDVINKARNGIGVTST